MKTTFEEKFAFFVFCCLFSYICICTVMNIKTDSIRDSWSIILLIVGTVWKNTRKQPVPAETAPGNTTATINAKFTTSPEPLEAPVLPEDRTDPAVK